LYFDPSFSSHSELLNVERQFSAALPFAPHP
jgi:hypothetical protein